MRPLSTIKAVPRPDLSFLAVQGLTLAVYLALEGRDVVVLGKPAASLDLTIAFFVLANLARNVVFGPNLHRGRTVATFTIGVVLCAANRARGQRGPTRTN